MSLIRNFLTLKVITVTDQNLWMLLAIWVVLVFAGLWSIHSREMPIVKKFFWGVSIICLPIIGLLLYSVSCLFSVEWEVMHRMGFLSKSKKKIIDSINSSQA